ncbi:MAG: XdhC family protein [Holophagales bacterium]|jgi:xanthine dehydrogenase accessory factor|nr:XdhC family protein [Holophagales bacterium]MBK9969045.1 XdhC family protein [Holophagales bacterium]
MSLEILQAIASGRPDLALCTVVQVKGSAPRHVGSKMLAGPEGLMAGSVGGGRGEAAALAACVEALATRRPAVLQIEMQGTEAEGPDMVCGGFSRILVEPLSDPAPYRAALDLVATGARALLVKRVETGETAVLGANGQWASGQLEGLDPARALGSLETGHAALIEDAGLFVDPVLPREKLLILGGGHVGRALAAITPGLGFAVTVADERLEFLEPERFPAGVETRLGSFPQIVASYPFDLSTYVVIVTRGHLCDLECARAVIGKPYRYAGLMGSRRKTRLMVEQLLSDGADPARVDALYAPIGQEIGAETPEELAVAIAGELIAVRHGAACLAAQRVARREKRGAP